MPRDATPPIPVVVIVERRPSTTPWAMWSWRATELRPGPPTAPDWTVLGRHGEVTTFLAGAAGLATDLAPNGRDAPQVWVLLRPAAAPHGLVVDGVTLDGRAAAALLEAGRHLVDALPLPAFLADRLAAWPTGQPACG